MLKNIDQKEFLLFLKEEEKKGKSDSNSCILYAQQ